MSWAPRGLTQASISITSTPSEVGDQRQGYPLFTDDETKVQVKYWPRVSTWLIRKRGLAYIFWPQTPWYSATVQPPPLFIKQVIERWYFILQWLLTDLSEQLAPLVLAEGSLCNLLLAQVMVNLSSHRTSGPTRVKPSQACHLGIHWCASSQSQVMGCSRSSHVKSKSSRTVGSGVDFNLSCWCVVFSETLELTSKAYFPKLLMSMIGRNK